MNRHSGRSSLPPMSANFGEMKVRDVIRWMAAAYPSFDKEQCLNYAKQFELDLKKNNLKLSTGYKSVLRVVLRCRSTPRCCYSTSRRWGWTPSTGSCSTSC